MRFSKTFQERHLRCAPEGGVNYIFKKKKTDWILKLPESSGLVYLLALRPRSRSVTAMIWAGVQAGLAAEHLRQSPATAPTRELSRSHKQTSILLL